MLKSNQKIILNAEYVGPAQESNLQGMHCVRLKMADVSKPNANQLMMVHASVIGIPQSDVAPNDPNHAKLQQYLPMLSQPEMQMTEVLKDVWVPADQMAS